MKTFAEQYIEQGISLGAEKLRLEIAAKMLACDYEQSEIVKITKVSPQQLATILQPLQTENVAETLTSR
jgi:hypothetical protein